MNKTDNELIAEFDGWIPDEELENYYRHSNFHGRETGCSSHNMSYNSSWDWLMPVVEKIETLGFYPMNQLLRSEKDKRYFFNITTVNHECLTMFQEETKILATYKGIVEFIKWHNSQK